MFLKAADAAAELLAGRVTPYIQPSNPPLNDTFHNVKQVLATQLKRLQSRIFKERPYIHEVRAVELWSCAAEFIVEVSTP